MKNRYIEGGGLAAGVFVRKASPKMARAASAAFSICQGYSLKRRALSVKGVPLDEERSELGAELKELPALVFTPKTTVCILGSDR